MKSNPIHIAQLMLKKKTGELTAEESVLLEQWKTSSGAHEKKYEELLNLRFLRDELSAYNEAEREAEKFAVPGINATLPRVNGKLRFFRQWRWVAAALILVMAAGVLFRIVNKKNGQFAVIAKKTMDIHPGKEGAVLTLANGAQVVLDSVGSGVVAVQNGAQAVMKDGKLMYDVAGVAKGDVVYNTMSTPKGRQFNLLLPDGTKVWLNAASSIRFPTVFTRKERRVAITGEAYLEVAKDRSWPFIVNIDGHSAIEVLGTSFNVNSYGDEGTVKTTLIEGRIKITRDNKDQLLLPGQQALTALSGQQLPDNKSISIVTDPDIDQVLAWKNGYFSFDNTGLRQMTRQLERWYDIQIEFQGDIPDIRLKGEMDRGVELSEVIQFLTDYGLATTLHDRTLILQKK